MRTWTQHFSRSIWFQIIWSNSWISVLKKCNPPPPRVFRMGKCCRRLQNVTFFHTPRAVSYFMDTCWGKKENCWRAIFSWLRLIPGYKFMKTRQMDSLDDVTTTFVPSTQKCSVMRQKAPHFKQLRNAGFLLITIIFFRTGIKRYSLQWTFLEVSYTLRRTAGILTLS